MDKIKSYFRSWKCKILLIGRKLCLLKFVLSNLPFYYMSLFKISSRLVKKIEFMQMIFL